MQARVIVGTEGAPSQAERQDTRFAVPGLPSQLRQMVRGRVVVGTSDTNCTYVLPEVLGGFRSSHPEVAVAVRNKMSTEVGQLVLEDRADSGIVTLPVSHRSLRTEAMFAREDVLICPVSHRLGRRRSASLKTAAAEPLLLLEHGSRSRTMLDEAFADADLHPQVAMDLGSIEVIKRFVEAGFGVAVVPRVAVTREVAEGRLAALRLQELPARQVGLVTHRGCRRSAAAAALVEMIRQRLRGTRL